MPDISKEIEEIAGLISLPEIYLKVRRLLDDDASDVNDFVTTIAIDPNLSTRVLRVVNSAYYGLSEPVDDLPQALNLLGLDRLHQMVLGMSAVSSLDLPNDILPLKTFWFTSLYTGVLARVMGDSLQIQRTDRLFLAGLLHDIGNLVLCAKFPDFAREVAIRSLQTGQPQHEIQKEMFGLHYGEIGAKLLDNWNLSSELQSLVCFQPTPLQATDQQLEAALLHLAHTLTTSQAVDIDQQIETEVRKLIPIEIQRLEEMTVWARGTSEEIASMIAA